MTQAAGTQLSAEWVEALLGLPVVEQRLEALRAAGLWHADGLGRLLDHAGRLMRSDPGRAGQVAELCMAAASAAAVPALWPPAAYLRAQTHAIRGDFSQALELILAARDAYEALGDTLAALRTNIGRMHVLNELGRHGEALEAGQAVLDALGQAAEPAPPARMLLALAHQNRGVCFETIGQYEAALDAYAQAEAHFDALGMADRAGEVINNRGIVLMQLGRVGEALNALEAVIPIWASAGMALRQAQALSNLGEAHLLQGSYTRSLQAFEQARRLFDPLDAGAHKGILLRKTADAYLALNLYPEALAAYREAKALLQEARMADHRARARWGQGAALSAQGQLAEAGQALAEAAALFEAAGNTPMRCSVWLEQAAVQQALGDAAAALATARQALALVEGEAWPVQRLYASLRVADLLLPDAAAAEPYLARAAEAAEALSLPVVRYRVESRLGHLRRLQGRAGEAQVHLEAALECIEALRGGLALEALRTSFLRDKIGAYEDLLLLQLEPGGPASVRQAFAAAERAKSRTLVDLLTGLRPARPAPDAAPAARLQALQADLSAAYNHLLEAPAAGDGGDWQRRAGRLEEAISQLRLRAGGSVEAPDQLAGSLSFEALQAQLPPDLLVVAYHTVGDEILAFVRGPGELRVARRLSRPPQVRQLLQRLNAQWDRFRAGAAFAQRHMRQLEESTRRVLRALHAELVAPLEPWLQGYDSDQLAIVPHGLLHSVPFHALHDGQQYLLDRYTIAYAPSVTVLALCQGRGRGKRLTARRAVVAGVPDALIPAAEAEVYAVARQLAQAQVPAATLIGGGATAEALRSAVPGAEMLHLACHGLFRADNPMFSALKLHDAWLTAADVMQLDLAGALVVLSACESGRGTVIPGDEVVGLPRACLGAGAAAVVVSLWLVPDATTAALMADCYGRLAGGAGRAAALQAAQQALRESHPHPYYWAPFVLIGQR